VQTCGAFSAIDTLVHESTRQDPEPGQKPPRTYDLIGLASALNNARAEGSPALDSAITAYVYALTNLGAVIIHHEPVDDIESMYVIANMTGHTVTTLCQRDWVCEVDTTVRVRVTVTARNAAAAAGAVDDYMLADAIGEFSRTELYHAIQDRDVVDTEEA
jgi:hypothetical protein